MEELAHLAVRYRHLTMQQCKLSFGWLVRCGRETDGLTQKGLCSVLKNHYDILVTQEQIEDIENNTILIASQELAETFNNYFVDSICELFGIDRSWADQILEQEKSNHSDKT